ncbi:MAG TPA: TerB family tellurite resistance protein [Gemmatimonadales bacterium]|nr:TerB family tellurite resistance protein [Gemmatimonadales bacterium]
MNDADREAIITIALLAALSDGQTTAQEKAQLERTLAELGAGSAEQIAARVAMGQLRLADVTGRLSDDEARRLAYQTATIVCGSDGPVNAQETNFLAELQAALGLETPPVAEVRSGEPPGVAGLDEWIQQQAVIAAALELLPEKLANLAILPVQLRMVYRIGQQHGQALDANQVMDLAGALGIGAAAQVVEGTVRKIFGGLTKGIFGGMVGGAAGLAAGAAVTFASTYALGHVAQQYYAQGRSLSTADLKQLFTRFQGEAQALFPKLQDQVQSQAKTLNLQNLMSSLRS